MPSLSSRKLFNGKLNAALADPRGMLSSAERPTAVVKGRVMEEDNGLPPLLGDMLAALVASLAAYGVSGVLRFLLS